MGEDCKGDSRSLQEGDGMRILQLSFNSAKTFKQRLYGVSMYTLGTNRILRELGDVDLYVVAPTVF